MSNNSRESKIQLLANAAISGRLGLFVGTGYSKAVTNGRAPSFQELLQRVADHLNLGVDIDSDQRFFRKSYPQVASELVKLYQEKQTTTYEHANLALKEGVATLCNLYAERDIKSNFSKLLAATRPSWIITTNYDLLLESMFDEPETLLADQPIMPNTHRVPIVHLHGNRYRPESVRITEEDYVSLLGPLDYQRLRLPLLLLESTTLMIGYSLGDINVRAAMAAASSFQRGGSMSLDIGQGAVIQALYTTDIPRGLPYEGPTREVVIEIQSLHTFLEELGKCIDSTQKVNQDIRSKIDKFLRQKILADSLTTGDGPTRALFLDLMKRAPNYLMPNRIIEALDHALDPIWERAHEPNQFSFYDTFLTIVLDVLDATAPTRCHPSVFGHLASKLNQVAYYIDPNRSRGSSYAATATWLNRVNKMSLETVNELESFGKVNNLHGIEKLLAIRP